MQKRFTIISHIVLCALLVMSLGACSPDTSEEEQGYVSPYTWSNLQNDQGRLAYYKNDLLASRIGIDVSEHQGEIDWQAVSDDGVDFAMIRLGNRGYTEGKICLDARYEENISSAKESGVMVGVYFFSQAINEEEARDEAEFVLDTLDGMKLDYPIVFDHEPVNDQEGRANKLSRSQLTKNAQAFCEIIEDAGYRAMIYGNKSDISKLDLETLKEYDFWFAEYDVEIPSGQFDFSIWQYSNNGAVQGISTRVDMNIHFLAS